jgi:hypothetical protein
MSPLEKGDHPAVEQIDNVDKNAIKKYQSMICCLQWAVLLGQFDIHDHFAIPSCSPNRILGEIKTHLKIPQ